MRVYYNEHDRFAAAWLRELMAEGAIPQGDVDERDIWDVSPDELRGYTQCHFFAGIGGWAEAIRLSGWPVDRPVWTGSCPCQPYSAAGKGGGMSDERHLWPAFHHLIRECRPPVVFGEQVDAAIRHGWVDLVQSDLERDGYVVGWADLPAASVGAPHLRQRLWFVAESQGRGDDGPLQCGQRQSIPRIVPSGADGLVAYTLLPGRSEGWAESGGGSAAGGRRPFILGDPDDARPQGRVERGDGAGERPAGASSGVGGELADAKCGATERRRHDVGTAPGETESTAQERERLRTDSRTGEFVDFWSSVEWLPCRDGKARPVEPGIFPLAHGVPNRVGTLRGAGNAVVPQVAAEVIRAYMESR